MYRDWALVCRRDHRVDPSAAGAARSVTAPQELLSDVGVVVVRVHEERGEKPEVAAHDAFAEADGTPPHLGEPEQVRVGPQDVVRNGAGLEPLAYGRDIAALTSRQPARRLALDERERPEIGLARQSVLDASAHGSIVVDAHSAPAIRARLGLL